MSRGTPDPAAAIWISRTGLSPFIAGFPKTVLLSIGSLMQSITLPEDGLGSSAFARHY